MRAIAFLPLLFSVATPAQNWVLINPAYKYNYSNDGTDTISNQIRVMDIDTLGVDSFRYVLNQIGVICDTCPASLGGPCDGCYVRIDQPQFLGYECIRSGNEWLFNGVDTFFILTDATIGASWMYNESEGITAMADAEWPDLIFGMADTLQRILLSDGDTLLISQSLGILRSSRGEEHHDLLGVEGLGVGHRFPEPLAYFDYQPGDELTYKVSSVYGWFQIGFTSDDHYWKVIITDRVEALDSIEYATSVTRTYTSHEYLNDECNWPIPLDTWRFSTSGTLAHHPILSAYPGQVMDTSLCYAGSEGYEPRYLAQHGITEDGRTIMYSLPLGQAFGAPSSGFNGDQEVAPDVFPFLTTGNNVLYEQGIGLRLDELVVNPSIIRLRVELVGAIIDGDTLMQPPPITGWNVAMEEENRLGFGVFPDPASAAFTIRGAIAGKTLRIYDLEGRLVRNVRVTGDREVVDVHDMNMGLYVLRLDGMPPQRLMIAR